MALGGERNRTVGAWALAGVPILVTFVQTTLALVETTLGTAGLGGLQDAIRSVPVFDAAAVAMWKSPALVFGLFMLIAGAWVAQGVAQFGRGNRDVTFAAAGLVSVLFFALFLGVYSPLFGQGIPVGQLAAFFAVPVVASGAAVGAALTHDWEADVVEEKTTELAGLQAELDDERDAFESGFRQRFGDLGALEAVAPTGVERARDRRAAFRERCVELEDEVRTAEGSSASDLRTDVAALRGRVEELDAEATLDGIDEELRERVASGVRTTYGTVQVWSDDDRSYNLVNLPSRFRETEIPAFDTSVHIDRVDDALLDRLDDGVALATVADAVGDVRDHVDRVERYVAERESEFADAVSGTESDLDTATEKVERFDGPVGERLAEIVVDGRHESLPSVRAVRRDLDAARDALADCQFDDARRQAEDAAEEASDLVRFVEFVWSLVGTVDHGGARVSVPPSVDADAVTDLRPAFERAHGVTFTVDGGAVQFEYGDDATEHETSDGSATVADAATGRDAVSEPASSGRTTADAAEGAADDESAGTARPEEIIDSVLYVFRELKLAGKSGDGSRAELQTDHLPESVATPAVLSQIERFAARQTDVVGSIEVQSNAPPGFVELEPAAGMDVTRTIDALHERYQERYA